MATMALGFLADRAFPAACLLAAGLRSASARFDVPERAPEKWLGQNAALQVRRAATLAALPVPQDALAHAGAAAPGSLPNARPAPAAMRLAAVPARRPVSVCSKPVPVPVP